LSVSPENCISFWQFAFPFINKMNFAKIYQTAFHIFVKPEKKFCNVQKVYQMKKTIVLSFLAATLLFNCGSAERNNDMKTETNDMDDRDLPMLREYFILHQKK
jgi:hypothetical protein